MLHRQRSFRPATEMLHCIYTYCLPPPCAACGGEGSCHTEVQQSCSQCLRFLFGELWLEKISWGLWERVCEVKEGVIIGDCEVGQEVLLGRSTGTFSNQLFQMFVKKSCTSSDSNKNNHLHCFLSNIQFTASSEYNLPLCFSVAYTSRFLSF